MGDFLSLHRRSCHFFGVAALQLEDWNISYSLTDLRALFALEMLNQAENVSPRQEVVQAVRKKLSGQMEQYYYAVQNGYSVTEEELKMCMDEQDKIIKSASNFAEFEAYYEESGTTTMNIVKE